MSTNLLLKSLAAAGIGLLTTNAFAMNDPAGISQMVVPQMKFQSPDLDFLVQDDLRRDMDGLPMRFAVPHSTLITPVNSGTWDRTLKGRLRWQGRVTSLGVPHMNLGFGYWSMPDSGELMIENIDGTDSLGPYTSLDNEDHGELWLPVIQGDDLLITITCDDADRQAVENGIALTSVNVGYRGFGAAKLLGNDRSGSCNVDVACSEGDDWEAEIDCAGLYSYSGFLACSGSMVNNTNRDETPFFLTADHCGLGTSNDQSMVVYWNYENSFCREPDSNQSGGNGNGNLNQATTGGAVFRAGSGNSDFTLVELNNSPNANYNVGYCGWDRRTSTPQGGICIHHPNLEEKRISFDDNNLSSEGNYWRVNDWDLGTTEPGSSGSPLFNPDHRIVGQLFGGAAACGNNLYDVYGKISSSWNSGLGTYLDAGGTGEQFIDTLGSGNENGGVCCVGSTCFVVPIENCGCSTCTWYPDQTCGEVDCSIVIVQGACCLESGSCLGNQTPEQCASAGGDYQGDDSSCASANCPQPEPTGACCVNGNCISDLTAGECAAGSGEYQGNDTSCDFVNCDVVSDYVEFKHVIVGENLVPGIGPNFTVDIMAAVLPGNRIDAVAGNSSQSKVLSSTNGFYQNSSGGPLSTDINPNFYTFVPELEWDSRVTIGALDQTGAPFGSNALGSVGINWTQFENGGTLSVSNGTWYVLPDDEQGNAEQFTANDCSNREGVRIARLTVNGLDSTVSIEALLQGRDGLGNTWQDGASYSFDYEAIVDCNGNSVSDTCDIANGDSQDSDGNGIPDECDNSDCFGDINGDGGITVDDLLFLLGEFGQDCSGGCDSDINDDDAVDVNDLLELLGVFGNDC